MATGVLVGLSATEPLVTQAEAANYVSRTYTAPKKGQTGANSVALQRRLGQADQLETEYITGYFDGHTETAVKRFQRQVGLSRSARWAERTWNMLVAKTGKILIKKPQVAAQEQRRPASTLRDLRPGAVHRQVQAQALLREDLQDPQDLGCPVRLRRDARPARAPSRCPEEPEPRVGIYHTPMPFAMFFSGGQAVHYSSDFARAATTAAVTAASTSGPGAR